ncbi:MAG: FMN-binding protein, partial [Planctomycetota bacterium]
IRGLAIYEQEETPGLGGEIGSAWFRQQFEGKRIVSPGGEPGIRIHRGDGPDAPNAADGISGATMTCERMEGMLNDVIARIVKERHDDGE